MTIPTGSSAQTGKITASHLRRKAYVYIRQSTPRQVFENQESTKRQYGLRERVLGLGWQLEQIVMLDHDLGLSGASAADRAGFQRLVTEVGMGHAGIVVGLEVSRLARSCADWYRLLEICGLTHTLIFDEDGLYDPNNFNDRLLLGLKGTMSEAELHVLKSRLRGGLENKARRGELKQLLPVGFVHAPNGRVVLDPDQQVQEAVRLVFTTFRRTGSAAATVKSIREQSLDFPVFVRTGVRRGETIWSPLSRDRVLRMLHNPRYAGAFFFGRSSSQKRVDGTRSTRNLPREEWHTLILDAHPGYISWQDYEENQHRLGDNAQAHGDDRRKSPPREGPALLQGLIVCGVCGKRMTVGYRIRRGRLSPDYKCTVSKGGTYTGVCQTFSGYRLDAAIGELLLEVATPVALDVALTVQQELLSRSDEVDRLRRQKVERARYEADAAQRRYMRVDPDNRLVAGSLEADWNLALRTLAEAQQEYEALQKSQPGITDLQRAEVLALATNFPRLWQDPRTPDRERKRMVRLMLEDVTVTRGHHYLTVQVRFKGGATRVFDIGRSQPFCEMVRTDSAIVKLIDTLVDKHTSLEIATILNNRGMRTGTGLPFDAKGVIRVRNAYRIVNRYTRLRALGMLSVKEVAARLGVVPGTVMMWKDQGVLTIQYYTTMRYLIDPDHLPTKWAHKKAPSAPQGENQGKAYQTPAQLSYRRDAILEGTGNGQKQDIRK